MTSFHPRECGSAGKTSLARTAAQEISNSDREPIYVACSPGASALTLLRDLPVQLSDLAAKLDRKGLFKNLSIEASLNASPLGLAPSVKFAHKVARSETPVIVDTNEAVRIIKGFDRVIPDSKHTVVVIDELEEMDPKSRQDLAFFVKQIGDQLIETRFILVGIADNVHQLIGAHESVPRYLRNVELGPLRGTADRHHSLQVQGPAVRRHRHGPWQAVRSNEAVRASVPLSPVPQQPHARSCEAACGSGGFPTRPPAEPVAPINPA